MAATGADLAVRAPKVLSIEATVADVRAMFSSDHVHLVLIIDDGRLVTTIERADISADTPDNELARALGTLAGRTIDRSVRIDEGWDLLGLGQRRRLAVIDEADRLIGLLCLKSSRTGFCSDLGIAARTEDRAAAQAADH